jgi:hypothetical protein
MAKKAKPKKAKAKKRSPHKAAIRVQDDPRWRPLIEAYKLLLPQSGLHTGFDLLEALKSGELPSARRSATNPSECERKPASFWRDRQLDESMIAYGIIYIYGPDEVTERGRFRDPQTRLDGREFYVWRPEKVWPALAPQQADDTTTTPRARPGTKPKGGWPTLIAQWLIAVAADEPKRLQNVDALVVEAVAFLEKKIDWAPAETKHLRKRIVELLQCVPR